MQSPVSAAAELQHFLTVPPASLPPGNNNNPIAIAHAALESLRNSGDENFLFLRTILEANSSNAGEVKVDETLYFHCITGCRHVLLHQWNRFNSTFQTAVRDFFMTLGHDQRYSRTIQIACYTTSVSFWKRQWDEFVTNKQQQQEKSPREMSPKEQTLYATLQQTSFQKLSSIAELFSYLESLMQQPPTPSAPASAILYIGALVGEFAGKSAVSYRLPLEFHKKAHALFEKEYGLERCLHLTMGALSHVVAHYQDDKNDLARDIIQVTLDIINWEFGNDAFGDSVSLSTNKIMLLRPPVSWKELLLRPDFAQAIFSWYQHVIVQPNNNNASSSSSSSLVHNLGQLLLSLASLSGPIFADRNERKNFASLLSDGTLQLLTCLNNHAATLLHGDQASVPILDTLAIVSRLVFNYKLSILVEIPNFVPLLQGVTVIGTELLQSHAKECQSVHGDLESMENREWREEAIVLLLDSVSNLCGDPWLLYSGTLESRSNAQKSLADAFGPLHANLVQCRTHMARAEEYYLTANETDLTEVQEEISAVNMEEEMVSVALLGRLNISKAISCLSSLFQNTLPHLRSQWEQQQQQQQLDVSPEMAAMLEEARLLTMYIGHLLTDDCTGETPLIPDSIVNACQQDNSVINEIASAVDVLLSFAETQAHCVSRNPSDPRLSPLLAKSFLWFLNRWGPAYILPEGGGGSNHSAGNGGSNNNNSNSVSVWSSEEKAQESISFCVTLCLHLQSYWPHERQVQESASTLLLSLAKRGEKIRSFLLKAPTFRQMVLFHCLTAGIRHSASQIEFEAAVRSKISQINSNNNNEIPTNSLDMVVGYQRLSYEDKSRILTALLVTCSVTGCSNGGSENDQQQDSHAGALWKDCLNAVHETFSSLVTALASKQVNPNDVHVEETACLCIEMFIGIVHAGSHISSASDDDFDLSSSTIATTSGGVVSNYHYIPKFLTPLLSSLSGLMVYYAPNITICEILLKFFRDYTEQFVIGLKRDECLVLFQSSAELLKSYSTYHLNTNNGTKRRRQRNDQGSSSNSSGDNTLANVEEEQSYSDILCAMDLLIQLGTKDFMDICTQPGAEVSTTSKSAAEATTAQVTDMIFYGLQQIIPLMTQGLLQFPSLCSKYFSLVSFMMDTYPEKVCRLPFELFYSIIQSIWFGMKHHDMAVGKCCLQGLASILKEHLQIQCLQNHIMHRNENNYSVIDECVQHLLQDVIFQNLIWDRMEAAGMALLPLVAVDIQRFGMIIQELVLARVESEEQRLRLKEAFESLLKPDIINKVTLTGYEGRMNRIRFKKEFEFFCQDIHSFMVLK